MTTIKDAIDKSAGIFLQHVWPLWSPDFGGAELHPIENKDDPIFRLMDSFGVDAFYVKASTGALIPIASRLEYQNRGPRFTIRYKVWNDREGKMVDRCEFKKKVAALADLDSRRYLPLFTFQSVFVEDCVLHSLKVSTESLIIFARDNESAIKKESPRGTDFMSIPKADLAAAGIEIDCKP